MIKYVGILATTSRRSKVVFFLPSISVSNQVRLNILRVLENSDLGALLVDSSQLTNQVSFHHHPDLAPVARNVRHFTGERRHGVGPQP